MVLFTASAPDLKIKQVHEEGVWHRGSPAHIVKVTGGLARQGSAGGGIPAEGLDSKDVDAVGKWEGLCCQTPGSLDLA